MKWKVEYLENGLKKYKTLSIISIHAFIDYLIGKEVWFKVEPVPEVEDLE